VKDSRTPGSDRGADAAAHTPLYSDERRAEFPPGTSNLEIALTDALNEVAHDTRRMLQALDAYWLHCDGLPPKRYPQGRYEMEDWWTRFEKYRAKVEADL
jgi:hypothetical protein